MITKIAISFLILHGICVGVDHSLIKKDAGRLLEKAEPQQAIAESKNLLQEGDMVFRLNMDGYSQFIKKFNRHDKQYSHAGIVSIENDLPVVYHMVNGEGDMDNKMVKSSFDDFADPKKNYAFGIYRNRMSKIENQLMISKIKQWYQAGVQFDFEFNLETDHKMYCTEMMAKAIEHATNKRIDISSTKLTAKEAVAFAAFSNLPLSYTKNLKVVAIDNLYMHKWCGVVKEYRFY